MADPGNCLKARIRKGGSILGCIGGRANMGRERFQALVSRGIYDFILFDSQHSPVSEDSLTELCGIGQELDFPVFFRIKHTRQAYLIGTTLDLGPSGIEVPQVEEIATAKEAVDSFYFPRDGTRSIGGVFRVGAEHHPDPLDYFEWWNNHGVLML
jgi:2-keto-3-deoxy-L-rhamnonate aldolase RhmA